MKDLPLNAKPAVYHEVDEGNVLGLVTLQRGWFIFRSMFLADIKERKKKVNFPYENMADY